jgi:hypothetical protein
MPDQTQRPRTETALTASGRTRRIAGTCIVFLGGLLLLGSAGTKFARVPDVVAQMAANGFGGYKLPLVAALEAAVALLFLLPATRAAGVLLVSAYLGGAIATHLQHDQSPLGAAVLLAVILTGAWLRHPQVLWSLDRGASRWASPPDGAAGARAA